MANEIRATYDTGATLYALIFNAAGQIWNVGGVSANSFTAYAVVNWATYYTLISEIAAASGQYRGTFPAHASMIAGVYSVVLYLAPGAPIATDVRIGETATMYWDGDNEITNNMMDTILDSILDDTDLIDDATNGLAAIKAEVEGIGGITPEAAGVAPTANEIRDAILDDTIRFSGASIAAILADVTGINGDVMRGTNGVSLVIPDAVGTAAGLHGITDGLINAIQATVNTIEGYADLIDDATNGLAAIKAEVEGIGGVPMRGTDGVSLVVPDAAGVVAAYILSDVIGVDGDTLETLSDQMDILQISATLIESYVDTLETSAATIQNYTDTVEATLALIKTQTDKITTNQISIVSPVSSDGDITLVQGDDYLAADNTELEITVESWTSPNLTTATAKFRLIPKTDYDAGSQVAELEVDVDITWAASGDDAVFSIDLTAVQTAALSEPTPPYDKYSYIYQLQVTTAAGYLKTAALGSVYVEQEIT